MDMFLFILGLILLLAAVAGIIGSKRASKIAPPEKPLRADYAGIYNYEMAVQEYREEKAKYDRAAGAVKGGGILLSAIVALFGIVAVLLGFTTQVPAQNVGVVTELGKPLNRNLDAGLHFKLPWQKVTDMDGTIQQVNNTPKVDNQDPAKDPEAPRGLTEVRLDSGVVIYVENTLRWRIKQAGASQLFLDWKSFNRIDPGLIDKELKSALNVSLADYDPYVADSTTKEDIAKAKTQDRDTLSQEVRTRLESRIGSQIEVVGFNIVKLDVDEKTQANIQALQAARAETKKAEQDEKTAAVKARTNATIAKSLEKNPGVLVDKCLDIVRENGKPGAEKSGLPATLNCNFLTNGGKDVTLTQSTN